MTDTQRLRMWRRVSRGEARVVVGARSAIFAPVRDLGVVVVDEEHEPSFKQGSTPRYHAREVAVRRAQAAGAVCILGSATPSLESWRAAKDGRLEHLRLSERVSGHGFPPIEVVDLRSAPMFEAGTKGSRLFSRRLVDLLRGGLERKEQSILFQNRRGFAPVLWCSGCKATVRCEQCDVGLTWHRRIRRLVCHVCCEEQPVPAACPTCTKPGLHQLGAGSERVERELAELLPEARIHRMDSDTMRRREDYEETLEAFGKGEVDVLVGTQMIAKGLDFPRVTLVGIVNADGALHLPDFRASERTFKLVSQVAGRAGRGELAGRIVVQTTVPDHPAIVRAAAHDFEGFAAAEDALRGELGYPPHARIVRVMMDDSELAEVEAAALRCAEVLRTIEGAVVLGPAPAPIAMMRGRHRHHVLVKAPTPEVLDTARKVLVEHLGAKRRPRAVIDVDPTSVL
jgi:primosomal protein N' (replication factor Y)